MPVLRQLAYRRGAVAALVTVAALAITIPAGAIGTLDQSQPSFGPGFFASGNCGTISLAQTFTSGVSGLLDQVDVGAFRSPTSTSDRLNVRIHAVSGGVPSETVLASESIPASSLETSPTLATFTSVTLGSPVPVTAGETYAIVLPATNLPCFDGFWWFYVEGNTYSRGGALVRFGDGTWVDLGNAGQDFAFKTYVTAPSLEQQLAALLTMVTGIGPGNSLAAKVLAAQTSVALANGRAACAELDALTREVAAQRGHHLSTDQADAILAAVSAIEQRLGCA
jgi:hypothetical protein